jgi:hypothetical protein
MQDKKAALDFSQQEEKLAALNISLHIANGEPANCEGAVVSDISVYKHCGKITGFLAIVGSDVTNLNDLSNLRQIVPAKGSKQYSGYGLALVRNTKLVDVSGLSFLAGAIPGGVLVSGNPELQNLKGLEAVSGVGTAWDGVSISVVNNAKLGSTAALKGISGKLAGAVMIKGNPSLADTDGFLGLSSIGKNDYNASLVIQNNAILPNIDGFQAVTRIEGSVVIAGNTKLKDLNGLTTTMSLGADSLGRSCVIRNNPALKSLVGLSSVVGEIPGAMEISANDALTSMSGIQYISKLGRNVLGWSLDISSNQKLETMSKLKLQSVTGGLRIKGNAALKHLNGCVSLASIGVAHNGRSLEVAQNDAMRSVALKAVKATMGAVLVQNNTVLHAISLPMVQDFTSDGIMGRSIEIVENPKLHELDFSSCRSITGSLSIAHSNSLLNLQGFSGLTSIGCNLHRNSLEVANNAAMLNFKGLGRLDQMSCSIVIESNLQLQTLAGLDQLQTIHGASDLGNAISVFLNSNLVNLDALSKLNGNLPGGISIAGNPKLVSLAGLSNIARIEKKNGNGNVVELIKNPLLKDLSGLNLTGSIVGAIELVNNGIENVDALKNVEEIVSPNKLGDALVVVGNLELKNIDGFTKLGGTLAGGIVIVANPKLSSIGGLKGRNPIIAANYVQVGGIECLTQHDHEYLKSLCTTADCATNDIQASKACQKDCVIGKWSEYTPCLKTCGGAYQTRTRYVIESPENGGNACPETTQQRACGQLECPFGCSVGDWDSWGGCSKSCDKGVQTRERKVLKKEGSKFVCPPLVSSQTCALDRCAVDCVTSMWSAFDACSSSCGVGTWKRTRKVMQYPEFGGAACTDKLEENVNCDNGPCPVACEVTVWGEWSPCSASCGTLGTHFKVRKIVSFSKTGEYTCPSLSRVRQCNVKPCPVDCSVGKFSEWTACSKSCADANGPGERLRSRPIIRATQYGGKACPTADVQKACNTKPCPVNCLTSEWSKWSGCTATCGWGHNRRSRSILTSAAHGGTVCPTTQDAKQCDSVPCPMTSSDCKLSPWGDWEPCDVSCGGGHRSRYRRILVYTTKFGADCPAVSNREACGQQLCPQDCATTDWSAYGPCSVTCGGGGTQERHRRVISKGQYGGAECPHTLVVQECGSSPCPFHCKVSEWGEWTSCSKSCGEGMKQRKRQVAAQNLDMSDFTCPSSKQTQICNWQACPVDCATTDWKFYGRQCSKTCGEGTNKRVRFIKTQPKYGGHSCGPLENTLSCSAEACPIDCKVTDWSEWAPCSVTCGVGSRDKTRIVMTEPAHGGAVCPRKRSRSKACHAGKCPDQCRLSAYGPWGKCSATCGRGTKVSKRKILEKPSGANTCGSLEKRAWCNEQLCPVDCIAGPWSDWRVDPYDSSSNPPKVRERSVVVSPWAGGADCPELQQRQTPCNEAVYGKWSSCDSTGSKYRYSVRKCAKNGAHIQQKTRQTSRCTPNWGGGASAQASGTYGEGSAGVPAAKM